MKIVIEIAERTDAGYAAWCLALPGCAVRAATEAEAMSKMRDAVKGYLASMDVALPCEPQRRTQAEVRAATA